ncbi:MAG: response regulator [Bacteroidales bacterium]|nr:response regulator [Bacteroidales bacterium]
MSGFIGKRIFDRFRLTPYIGVGKSLFLWFMAIALIPLIAHTYFYYINAYKGLTIILEKTLVSTSNLRVENLNKYFTDITNTIEIEVESRNNIELLSQLNNSFEREGGTVSDFVGSDSWREIVTSQHNLLYRIAELNNLNDVLLLNSKGDVLFSTSEFDDLGTNIYNGKYSATQFAATARKVIDSKQTLFSDLEMYPATNTESGFFIRRIFDRKGEFLGLMALSIGLEHIDRIISDDAGIGETGVAYLIGRDMILRTASRFENPDDRLTKKIMHKKAVEWVNTYEYFPMRLREGIDNAPMEIISTYQGLQNKWVYGIVRDVNSLSAYGVNWALIEELSHDEVFTYPRKLSRVARYSVFLVAIIVLITSMLVTSRFVTPIKQLSAWAKQVAQGQLISKNIRAPKDEVGEMKDTFNQLVEYIRSVAEISQLIAKGDYSKKLEVRSEYDVLAESVNQMIDSFRGVVNQANTIANGDYSTNVVPRAEKDTLGIALYNMTNTLRESRDVLVEQDWLKTGLGKLADQISGRKSIDVLCMDAINQLVEYLNAQVGMIYVLDDDRLILKGSYALGLEENAIHEIELGEGLIGQVGKTMKMAEFTRSTDELPRIGYGIVHEIPNHVIISPLIYENQLIGVILIGTVGHFDSLQKKFFNQTMDNIAIAVNAAQANSRLQILFEETQQQKERLQIQQEELRQTNEELEEQTRALKQSEEKLQNQKEELSVINEELEERTKALERERDRINKANEKLEKAGKEIEQKAKDLELASQYKSEFLANMSHELRTPLNSILVLSQIMAANPKGNLDGKQIEFSNTIHSSGQDLLDLINEILDLSKVESGKMEFHLEELLLDSLISQVSKTFKPLASNKGLKFHVEKQDGVPDTIVSDPQRLYQIIKNLLSNALKFTEEGSIGFKVHRAPQGTVFSNSNLNINNTVGLTVSDTGIGIPADKLELIFEAFQQADGTTSRRYGGTGLGLSITKTFSEKLNGEVQVNSVVGKGTSFSLYLPVEIIESTMDNSSKVSNVVILENVEVEEPVDEEVFMEDDRDLINKGDKFVLIVEDDRTFAQVLLDIAREKGFKCMIAASGETGLHFTEKFYPSAIILDVGLPGIDGWEVMDRLKSNPKTRHIPIYFISALDKNIEAMRMGAVGFITKPASIDRLYSVFDKLADLVSRSVKRLLVIDDELIVRKSVIDLIGKEGIEIVDCEKGLEALQMMKKHRFDCVILDLGLEDVSGFEILEKMREEPQLKGTPVIIYTGQDLNHDEEHHLRLLADSIILKGARSPERLLAETTLFLHRNEELIPAEKKEMLHEAIKDKEAVFRNKTILVVDDDMRNVFALSSLLESKKMKTVLAKNGREGIEMLEKHGEIDLVLMDIMMPEMDGYEAMRKIRLQEKFRRLPIIALTAKAMKDDREKCIAAGANEYLSKPVDNVKLLSMLRVWLYS